MSNGIRYSSLIPKLNLYLLLARVKKGTIACVAIIVLSVAYVILSHFLGAFGYDDMVNEEMENIEGDIVNAGGAVNTATTGVSAASASITTAVVSISTAEPRTPPTTTTTAFEDEDLTIA
ncbi:hypothetical protein Tco_0831870 [Tanacetum coccineum]